MGAMTTTNLDAVFEPYEEISGHTLLIVGFGAIGRELARIAHQGFRLKVLAVTRDGKDADSPEFMPR